MHIHLPFSMSSVAEFFGHLALIVIGILIALGVEHALEKRKNKKLALRLVEALDKEILENKAGLERTKQSLAGVFEEFEAAYSDLGNKLKVARETQQPTLEFSDVQSNLTTPALNVSMWESAVATGAMNHLSLEKVNRYSTFYLRARDYAALRSQFIEHMIDMGRDVLEDDNTISVADAQLMRSELYKAKNWIRTMNGFIDELHKKIPT
ncbi:MAG: hypothetical protein ACRCV9_03710 [Burkholderiaceae bacterium]